MKTRREMIKLAAIAGVLGGGIGRAAEAKDAAASAGGAGASRATSGAEDRAVWCALAARLATPVLTALAERRLKAVMPVETAPDAQGRAEVTHLEALGRLLCGLAPWLELASDESTEGRERARFAEL